MVSTRLRSQQSLEQIVEALGMVQDEMLEQAQTFCPDITISTNHMNPLADPSEKESGVDD